MDASTWMLALLSSEKYYFFVLNTTVLMMLINRLQFLFTLRLGYCLNILNEAQTLCRVDSGCNFSPNKNNTPRSSHIYLIIILKYF